MAVGGAFKRLRPAIAEINTDNHSEIVCAPLAPPPPAGALYPEPTGFLGIRQQYTAAPYYCSLPLLQLPVLLLQLLLNRVMGRPRKGKGIWRDPGL